MGRLSRLERSKNRDVFCFPGDPLIPYRSVASFFLSFLHCKELQIITSLPLSLSLIVWLCKTPPNLEGFCFALPCSAHIRKPKSSSMAHPGLSQFCMFSLVHIALLPILCYAADPYVFYDLHVSYLTASPLGVPQQVHFLTLSHSLYC